MSRCPQGLFFLSQSKVFLVHVPAEALFFLSKKSGLGVLVEKKKLGCLVLLAKCVEQVLYFDTCGERGLKNRCFLLCLGGIGIHPRIPLDQVSSTAARNLPSTCAVGQDDVSLNKLPQTRLPWIATGPYLVRMKRIASRILLQ